MRTRCKEVCIVALLSLTSQCATPTRPEPAPAGDDTTTPPPHPTDAPPADRTAEVADAAAGDTSARKDAAVRAERAIAPDAFFGEPRCPAGVLMCDDFEA